LTPIAEAFSTHWLAQLCCLIWFNQPTPSEGFTMTTTNAATQAARATRDEALQATVQATELSRSYAKEAFDQAEGKIRELRGNVDPMVDKLADTAQKLARQSMELATEAKHKAEESVARYAGITTKYVSEQPMRSVLIAAAVGATVALLVAAARNNKRY
jgi:ElaB/YqjD/DUF883 family membrane-anchored ribosome-binding protein